MAGGARNQVAGVLDVSEVQGHLGGHKSLDDGVVHLGRYALSLGQCDLAGYLSLDVLCHGGVEPVLALKEAHRCLRPGAIAIFNLPAYGWLLSAHDQRVHNVRRFTGRQARALLTGNGFRVLRSSYWNTLLFPLMLIHRLLERDDAESDVRDFPRWLDALFSTALAIERWVIAAGINLPFGGSLIVVAARND